MVNLSNENVIHKEKNGIQYLQFKKLLEYNVPHAYGIGLNVDYSINNNGMNAYKNLCEIINLDVNNLVKPIFKHTNNVKIINKQINKPLVEEKEIDRNRWIGYK